VDNVKLKYQFLVEVTPHPRPRTLYYKLAILLLQIFLKCLDTLAPTTFLGVRHAVKENPVDVEFDFP